MKIIATISAILTQADTLISWARDAKEFALKQALQGVEYSGFKMVEGRSKRRYTDEAAVAEKVRALDLDPYEHKLLGITAMTKLLGKKRFAATLGDLLVKPDGKPVLVPDSDSREKINRLADDFADPINEGD